MANRNSRLELGTLENWLWEAACVIRSPIDAPVEFLAYTATYTGLYHNSNSKLV